MLTRRSFLEGVSGCLVGLPIGRRGGPETSLKKAGRPEETAQDLIRQIEILGQEPGARAHTRAIEDQIRVRLFLSGSLACKYQDSQGRDRLCVLCTKTGSLLTVPLRSAGLPEARREIEGLGLGHVLEDLRRVPWARNL